MRAAHLRSRQGIPVQAQRGIFFEQHDTPQQPMRGHVQKRRDSIQYQVKESSKYQVIHSRVKRVQESCSQGTVWLQHFVKSDFD